MAAATPTIVRERGGIVTADSAGGKPLIANRPVTDGWERFDLLDNAEGTVSFLAHANGK
jgi:hypothetical protein